MSVRIANSIQLKERISVFKKHIQNLQNSRSCFNKKLQNSTIRPFISNLMNIYEKAQLQQINNSNRVLLLKLINIQSKNKVLNQQGINIKFKQNYLKTKHVQRRRMLSEIGKQNNNLSQKLIRCSSQYKSSCFQWRNDIHSQQYYRNLTSKKYGKLGYDFRALAEKQLQQEKKQCLKLNRKNQFKPEQLNRRKLKG